MKKTTSYAIFYYSKEDKEIINELDNYLTQKADSIFEYFDSTLPRNTVNIRIIPTKKEYDEIVKRVRGINEVPDWDIGFCYDNYIVYLSIRDYKNTSHSFPIEKYTNNLDYYKKTILHEYVHFVMFLYIKKYKVDYPLRCFSEGLAQYLSGQRENSNYTFNYSLDDILNSNNCYIGWYLLTKYIIEKYGKEYFFKLFNKKEFALSVISNIVKEIIENNN